MKRKFFLLLTVSLLLTLQNQFLSFAQTMENSKQIQGIESNKTIESIEETKYKKMLFAFKKRFQKEDSFSVTSLDDCFEIIVTHPSNDLFTGGAEQYFLDKETGESKMGWHEHPMEIQKPDISVQKVD